MATLDVVTMAIKGAVYQRVFLAEVRTHGQASLERLCQSPQVQDETVAVWGPTLCDESRCVACGSRRNILVYSRIGGQMSSCAIEQTGTDALSRSRCSPTDTYCFKAFVRRSNRAQHTSIERHGRSSVMTQWAVCVVAMKVTDRAYDGIAGFTSKHAKKDSIEQQRSRTQEPSKQRVSQIGETWRGRPSEKLILTKSYVALDLIMCGSADHSQS